MSSKKKSTKGDPRIPGKQNYDLTETTVDAEEVVEAPMVQLTQEDHQQLLEQNVERGRVLGQAQAYEISLQIIDSYLVQNAPEMKKKTSEALQVVHNGIKANHDQVSGILQELLFGPEKTDA